MLFQKRVVQTNFDMKNLKILDTYVFVLMSTINVLKPNYHFVSNSKSIFGFFHH